MKIKSKIYSTCLLSMIAMSCSKEDEGESIPKPDAEKSISVFDTKEFKNTKSKEDTFKKADETKSIFSGIKSNSQTNNLRSNLMNSSSLLSNGPEIDEYNYASFPSCKEALDENESVKGHVDIKCMAPEEGENDIYYPTHISYIEDNGDLYAIIMNEKTFKREADGTFTEIKEETIDEESFEESAIDVDTSEIGGFENEESQAFELGAMDLFGTFDQNLESCDDAYRQFESMYTSMEQSLGQLVNMVKKPDSMNLMSNPPEGLEMPTLEEATLDDKSAAKYEFTNHEDNGFSADGFVSLGADDSKLLARMEFKNTMDSKKFKNSFEQNNSDMFGVTLDIPEIYATQDFNMAYGADLDSRIIELSTVSSEKATGDFNYYVDLTGQIKVSDGAEGKYVHKSMTMESKYEDENPVSFKFESKASLKEDGSIDQEAVITMNGNAIKYNFVMVKDEDGHCKVNSDIDEDIADVVDFFVSLDSEEKEESSPNK